jgi:hypothetical protein
VLSQDYPRLASFATNGDISVMEAMQADDLDSLFFLPLSQQAFQEFENLQARLQLIPYDDTATDRWVPTWGSKYTSRRFYSHIFSTVEAHPIFKAVWKSKCTPRIKFFAWLVLVDMLNTKSTLRRRHLHNQNSILCVMCNDGEEETIEHLFFACPFAQECWGILNFVWDGSLQLMDRLVHGNLVHNLPFFVEAVLIAAWELWKMRNDKVFQRRQPSPNAWLTKFKNQCHMQSVRFKDDLRLSFCVWLDAFS